MVSVFELLLERRDLLKIKREIMVSTYLNKHRSGNNTVVSRCVFLIVLTGLSLMVAT